MMVFAKQWDGLQPQCPACSYYAMEMNDCLDALQETLEVDTSKIMEEYSLRGIEQRLLNQITTVRRKGCFPLKHNGDFNLGRCCYLVCRALRPTIVLETGVAYGVTTSFLLDALAANGRGKLLSIDLPPLVPRADDFVGILVPRRLRGRWQLRRGISNRVLPRLLPALGQVDVFVHDSLHTYASMRSEFRTVWPFLRAGGVLIANDVEGNSAFLEFAQEVRPAFCAVVRQESKKSLFGLLVKEAEAVQRAGPVRGKAFEIPVLHISPRQKVRTDHLRAVALGLLRSEYLGRCL